MKLNLDIFKISRFAAPLCCAAGLISLAQDAWAGSVFIYNPRDMVLSLRKTGADGGGQGQNVFEVNLGQSSNYYTATPGTFFTNTQFNSAELAVVFDSINDLSWSVGGDVQSGDGGDATVPAQTIWVTAPRLNPNVQSSPWKRKSPSNQSLPATKIESIGSDAVLYSGSISANPTNNSPTTITIPVDNGFDADTFLGPNGDYSGNFSGDVESTTPANFTTSAGVSRSDLYELRPSTTANLLGKYLGYFEFRTNGTLVFSAATQPTLTVIRNGTTNTLSFTGITSNLYNVYFTNASGLSAATSNWPSFSTTILGGGFKTNIQDITTDPSRFYRVRMH